MYHGSQNPSPENDLIHAVWTTLMFITCALAVHADDHWAFQEIADPFTPAVSDSQGDQSPIDYFVLAELEERNLEPAPPAARRTRIRRATFDLTGLPPTPQEIAEFVADPSPDAYPKLVERLLA